MLDFFQQVYDFINQGIYDFAVAFGAWLMELAIIGWLETKLWALNFAWDIAKVFLNSINLSGLIQTALNGLPANVTAMLAFFRVPEAINILISGAVTRYALKFIPGGW